MGETRLQRQARQRAAEIQRASGAAIRRLREDAGLTLTAVARAAGIDRRFLARIESGEREPSLATHVAVLAVLGADLSVRPYPSTGPAIHDRIQAVMVEELLRVLDPRWVASPEVPVIRPARGVIDVVLRDRETPMAVVSEVQSELRRLEQQIRWHREKELSLPSSAMWSLMAGDATTSRLLVLRSTATTRDLAGTFEATLRAAYPARTSAIVASLTTARAPWPGPGIAWMRVEAGRATLLDRPPRGVSLGR